MIFMIWKVHFRHFQLSLSKHSSTVTVYLFLWSLLVLCNWCSWENGSREKSFLGKCILLSLIRKLKIIFIIWHWISGGICCGCTTNRSRLNLMQGSWCCLRHLMISAVSFAVPTIGRPSSNVASFLSEVTGHYLVVVNGCGIVGWMVRVTLFWKMSKCIEYQKSPLGNCEFSCFSIICYKARDFS